MEALRPSRQDDAPTTIPSDLRAYKELQRPSLGPCRREEAAALRRPLSHGASGDFHRQEPCSLHTRDAVSSPWVQWQASRSSPCPGDILEPWQRDPRLRRRRSVSTEAVMALTTDLHACAPLAAQAFHDRPGERCAVAVLWRCRARSTLGHGDPHRGRKVQVGWRMG